MRLRRRHGFAGSKTLLVAAMLAAVPVSVVGLSRSTTNSNEVRLARCPWLRPQQTVTQRVDELLDAMTPSEVTDLLHLHPGGSSVAYEGWSAQVSSVCLPRLAEQDGAAGVASGFSHAWRFHHVTQLPAPISDAAAFDPHLARAYGEVIGSEDAGKGVDLALSPTVNIDRDPLWGRSYETLGEDPYLDAVLAPQLVEGIQSNRVVSVVKHLVAYDQELHRESLADDSIVSQRALREIYLPPFATALEDGHAGAVMCAYNSINGTPSCQDRQLLQGILRDQWHFDGFIRSDCGSVYNLDQAIRAGVSQVKCTSAHVTNLLAADAADGFISKDQLDTLAGPLLNQLFGFNLIASPHPSEVGASVATAQHYRVALRTADEGSVLLKNAVGLLPLDFAKLRSLALIGPNDGTPMPSGFGALEVVPTNPVSALQALRGRLGSKVAYADGSDIAAAAALARRSEVAIVVVHDVESERVDRTTLALPGNQDRLVRAVAAANPRTVVVLETGSAVLLPWLGSVRSVLETWYPGEVAGTSLVQLLSGQVDPSGKLPVTFPASASARPDTSPRAYGGLNGRVIYSDGINVGYRWYEVHHVRPAFAFGYGLSYTEFEFSRLHIARLGGDRLMVTAAITNIGRRSGSDVVQVYVGDPRSTGEAPRQLKGFQRVSLLAGQTKLVHLSLSSGDLAVWEGNPAQWEVVAGRYQIRVGDSSAVANLPLLGSVGLAHRALGVNSGPALTQTSNPGSTSTTRVHTGGKTTLALGSPNAPSNTTSQGTATAA